MARCRQVARRSTGPALAKAKKEEEEKKKKEEEDEDVKPKRKRNVEPKKERNVKPKVEKDVKPTATVKKIPLDWLKFTSPEDLQKLLLQGCSSSPSFNTLVAASIAKLAPLLAGDGPVEDFKEETAEIITQLATWYEGEMWPEIVQNVERISVSKKSPLLSKLNALEALTESSRSYQLLPYHIFHSQLSCPLSSAGRLGTIELTPVSSLLLPFFPSFELQTEPLKAK